MSFPFVPPSQSAVRPTTMLLDAVRCWRHARDARQAAQPALHALLAPEELGMLAPVLDGLFAAFEAAHGRRFEIADDDGRLSQDERSLLDTLDGGSAVISSVMTGTLRIAVRSTVIVVAQEDDPHQRHPGQERDHAASFAGRSTPLMATSARNFTAKPV